MQTESQEKYKNRIITIPNLLSAFRICLIPVFIWLYCEKQNYAGTAIVLLISGITDLADGFIARRFHMISDLGKALDPISDKLTQAAMLFCLITRFPLMRLLFIIMIIKELFTGLTTFLVIQKSGVIKGADWHGKITTTMLYSMIVIHLAWFNIPSAVSNILIIACFVMMIISCIIYAIQNIKFLLKKG